MFDICCVVLNCMICVNVLGVEESVKQLHEIYEWSCGNVQPICESQVHCSSCMDVWSSDTCDFSTMKHL